MVVKWHLSKPHGIQSWIPRWCSCLRVGFSENGRLSWVVTSHPSSVLSSKLAYIIAFVYLLSRHSGRVLTPTVSSTFAFIRPTIVSAPTLAHPRGLRRRDCS